MGFNRYLMILRNTNVNMKHDNYPKKFQTKFLHINQINLLPEFVSKNSHFRIFKGGN